MAEYRGFKFKLDPFLGPTSVGEREWAFVQHVIDNRDLGFGRMIQIIGDLWDQVTPGKMGSAHVEAAKKRRPARRKRK